MTGTRYEQRLAALLSDLGYAVMRSPASGSATDRDQPDILAAHPTEATLALELKSGSASILYVDGDEVEALERFAAAFDARPMLVARYTSQATPRTYYAVDPRDARHTEGGNCALPVGGIHGRASITFEP